MQKESSFDVEGFLQRLIEIPSCDPPGGELAVAKLVHETLFSLGVTSELDEFLPGRANVLGRVPGANTHTPLVFSAHMDTVPEGGQPWSFDAFAGDKKDGLIRGRGASDMKSAVACFVAAAAQIAERDTPLGGDVLLAFTAGESANCLGARRFVEQGLQGEIGAFLCGEPSSLDLIVVEKAILWIKATAKGEIGHVSGAAGKNAINMMAQFILDLSDLTLDLPEHPLLSLPTINTGRIEGGSAVNLTPDTCTAEIDVRFGPGIEVADVMAQLDTVVPAGISLAVTDFKPAVEEPASSDFVNLCSKVTRHHTGRTPEIKGVSYYSDGAILLDGIKAPFVILGPGILGMSGQADEVIPVENLHKAVEIYREIAEEWLGA